jgi:hypothetical protein
MVALIEGKNLEGLAKHLAQGSPVFQRTEQTVQNKKGMPVTVRFEMEGHRVLFTPR